MDAVVAWGFLFLLVASVVGVGWWQIKEGGKRDAEANEVKRDLTEAGEQIKRHTDPVPTNDDYLDRMLDAEERDARLRDRETQR